MNPRDVFTPNMTMPGLTKQRRRQANEEFEALMARGAPRLWAHAKAAGSTFKKIAVEEPAPGTLNPAAVAIAREMKQLVDRQDAATFGKTGEKIDVVHREVDTAMRAIAARVAQIPGGATSGDHFLMHMLCAAGAARAAIPQKDYLSEGELLIGTAMMATEEAAIEAANIWCDRATGDADDDDDGVEYHLTVRGALYVMAELDPAGSTGRGRQRLQRVQERVAAVRLVFPTATTEQALARAFDLPALERRVEELIRGGAEAEGDNGAFERALDEAIFGGAS